MTLSIPKISQHRSILPPTETKQQDPVTVECIGYMRYQALAFGEEKQDGSKWKYGQFQNSQRK